MREDVAVLEAVDVVKRYADVVALDGVSLRVDRGERVALIGESGSGKTTLLRTFNRMVDPEAGRVRVDGREVRAEDPVTLRRSIGYVQQEGGLLPHWTVERNVRLVPTLNGMADASDRARESLDLVGLDPVTFGARWPRELSGGQRQRVALARALAAGPAIVLLDEPFGALDAITRGELQETFAELVARVGVTVLLVTHDLREAALLAGRVVVLREGRVEQSGPPDELLHRPATAYVRRLHERAGLA